MANRRMFSNRIANSARFLQMPAESQLLYFHMVLRADDDGIVESYPLIKLLGIPPDNFKILCAKGFIKQLNEDQVIVIRDWLEHNTIRADRKIDSIYKHLLLEVAPEIPVLEPKPRSDVKDNSKRLNGGQSTDGISKVKLSKDNINTSSATPTDASFELFWDLYPKKVEKKKSALKWKKIPASIQKKILEDVPKRKTQSQWLKGYIPNPLTYLNGERWNDEYENEPKSEILTFEAQRTN